MEFFGITRPFKLYVPPKGKRKELPEAVLKRDLVDIEHVGILNYMRDAFHEYGIASNDFAKLLFIVSFVNAIEFEEDTLILSLSQMVRYKKTGDASRALLAAALLQSLGFDALAVTDNREQYHLSASLCRDERTDSMATNASFRHEGKVYYLIDPSLRYPLGMMSEEPGSSFKIIGESRGGRCISFFSDTMILPDLPRDPSQDRKIGFFLNYKNRNYDIDFYLNGNVRDYVSNFPLSLPLFFATTKEEVKVTGCMTGILQYLKELKTEEDKVNFLLGIAQDSALCIYLEGAIKPTTITLFSREADCDTRSQLLAGLLLNAGFKRILVLTTAHHLALALAPEDEEKIVPGGKYIFNRGRKYYFLDPGIINGRWGTGLESSTWEILMELEEMYPPANKE